MGSEVKVKVKIRKFHGMISKSEIFQWVPESQGTPVVIVHSKGRLFWKWMWIWNCPITAFRFRYLYLVFAASQEIPRFSRNPKVHYRTHKRPPPVSILGQPTPVNIPTSHLLKIHPNIIHPSTPRSPQWSPSLRFPQQDPKHPLSSPIRATCPACIWYLGT